MRTGGSQNPFVGSVPSVPSDLVFVSAVYLVGTLRYRWEFTKNFVWSSTSKDDALQLSKDGVDWRSPVTFWGKGSNWVTYAYPAQIQIPVACRILSTPTEFHWNPDVLPVPFRGPQPYP